MNVIKTPRDLVIRNLFELREFRSLKAFRIFKILKDFGILRFLEFGNAYEILSFKTLLPRWVSWKGGWVGAVGVLEAKIRNF